MLSQLAIGAEEDERGPRFPRRRVYLGVCDRNLDLQQSVVHTLVVFRQLHFIAMGIASLAFEWILSPLVLFNPRSIVIAVRLDNECVSVPSADGISVKSRDRRIRRQFAPVGPDIAPYMTNLKEFQSPARQLNEFESVVVGGGPRKAQGIADVHWIFGVPLGRIADGRVG